MKIYFVGVEEEELEFVDDLLLSYFDLEISKIPFRKLTFKKLLEENKDKKQNKSKRK